MKRWWRTEGAKHKNTKAADVPTVLQRRLYLLQRLISAEAGDERRCCRECVITCWRICYNRLAAGAMCRLTCREETYRGEHEVRVGLNEFGRLRAETIRCS